MSIAVVQRGLSASPTWRQFQQACLCVLLAIGVGCVLYGVETLLLRCERRFVENPAETMTRAIGLAHFSIGWLFLFTSPRLRNRAALTRLALWTAFGVTFCWIFAQFGADKNPLLMMAYFSFFFVHEVCDEAFLFRTSGELAQDGPRIETFMHSLCWSMSLLLMAMLAAAQLLRGHMLGQALSFEETSTILLVVAWFALSLLSVGSILLTMHKARSLHGSILEAVTIYRPLLAVYAGIAAIMLVGSFFGSSGAILVILVHGLTWLVCTYRKLSERQANVTGLWSWLRNSPTGFLTLHLSVTVLALVLFALRTHLWERTGFVCDLVSRSWFPYWSIMHIAMAFWRTK